MKVFQTVRNILAAQILNILQHESGEKFLIQTDAEAFEVDPGWVSRHQPQIGGFITMEQGGATGFMPAAQLLTTHKMIGEVALGEQAQPATDTAAAGVDVERLVSDNTVAASAEPVVIVPPKREPAKKKPNPKPRSRG